MYKLMVSIQGHNYVSAHRNGNQIGVLIGDQKGKWLAFAATAKGLIQVGAFYSTLRAAVLAIAGARANG